MQFEHIRKVAEENSKRVLDSFSRHRVSDTMFAGTTGYGYDDQGRDTLDKIYADVFGAEDALVRPQLMSGTHALAVTLGGLLKHGQTLLYISGEPYDTLRSVIGTAGESRNSLIACGVRYEEIDLVDNDFDYAAIEKRLSESFVRDSSGICSSLV